jgi:hypothetical protein
VLAVAASCAAAVSAQSGDLMKEAGAKIARWYADALQVQVRDLSPGMYSVSEGELSLMVLVDEKAVRVSCEHRSTQDLAAQEGREDPRFGK